jgi:spermidine/putrescine-binding protein
MSYKSFSRDLKAGALSRRQMLVALASVGIVVGTYRRTAGADDANLTVFTWAGYDDPKFCKPFVVEHGAAPKFTIFGETEEGLQKLRGGFTADVAHPCTSTVGRWNDAGVLRPVDVSKVEQWKEVFPSFRVIPGVLIGDQIFNVPFDWGNESVLYRKDLVDASTNSIALMTDEKYQGKLAMYDSGESMAALAGTLSGAKDPFAMTDAEIPAAKEVMKKINANVRFYWTDTTQITQALAAGEIVAAWAWNAAVVDLKKQGVAIEYMHPKEGIFTWVCGMSLVHNHSGSEQQAYDYINAMLDPETGKTLINDYGYGHSNRQSFTKVDPKRLDELGIANPEDMLKHSRVYMPTPPATKEKLIKIFDEVKAGI